MHFTMNITRKLSSYLILFSTLTIQCQGQSIIESDQIIYSSILQQEVKYSVLLPPDYMKSDTVKYPVIYLLHGINGDQNSWLQRCKINTLSDSLRESGAIGDFIIVMPAAYNSYYINNYDSSFRYMDFFIEEFVPAIDSIYRTTPGKQNCALMGISMGGFGSIIIGLKYPEYFGSIVSLSAAVRDEEIFKGLPQTKYNSYFGKVYGFGLSADDRITDHWKANSPYYITDTNIIALAQTQNWYIDCGFDDFLFQANETFHQWLTMNKIPHEYHVRSGEHNWIYWYRSTVNGLIYLDERIIDCSDQK
jgi:enterochelin esterase-like enzyme